MGLYYETVKLVAIRDCRLVSLRYLFVVVISAYVIKFELLGSGGYLTASSTVGVVRFSSQATAQHLLDRFCSLCRSC